MKLRDKNVGNALTLQELPRIALPGSNQLFTSKLTFCAQWRGSKRRRIAERSECFYRLMQTHSGFPESLANNSTPPS